MVQFPKTIKFHIPGLDLVPELAKDSNANPVVGQFIL